MQMNKDELRVAWIEDQRFRMWGLFRFRCGWCKGRAVWIKGKPFFGYHVHITRGKPRTGVVKKVGSSLTRRQLAREVNQ